MSKLIEQGVDVYLIDNASTDGTAQRVEDLIGRGVIDIETARFFEDEREVLRLDGASQAQGTACASVAP